MKIYIHRATGVATANIGDRTPLQKLEMKRGDTFRLQCVYHEGNGEAVELTAGTNGVFIAKEIQKYNEHGLFEALEWSKLAAAEDGYMLVIHPAGDALETLLGENDFVNVMGEVTWVENGETLSTQKLTVVVNNDLYRDNEPTIANPSPAWPLPADVVTHAQLTTALAGFSGAGAKLVTVESGTARKALTASAVNVGDVVEEVDTRDCYAVLDTTLLVDDAGFVKIGTRAMTYNGGGGDSSLLANLVGYWKLDGNSDDASGNGWTLSATNSPGFVSGKIGQAASFDGANYLSSADLTATMRGQSLTVSFWAKFDQSQQTFVTPGLVNSWSGGGAFNFHLWQDGGAYQVRFAPGSTNAVEAVAPSDVGWHHYLGRFDASTGNYDLWIDGAQAAQQTGGVMGSVWTLGIRIGSSDDPFVGQIDEAGLWKRLLTDAEVTALYNSGNGKTCPFSN